MATAATNLSSRKLTTFDVFVGNLPQDADQKRVGKLFSKFGEVHNIWINSTSEGNKYALVKFYCEEDSTKAIEDTNGLLFEGKPLVCRKAVKRGSKKEADQDGQEESIKQQLASLRPRNPDIVPSFENSSESNSGIQPGIISTNLFINPTGPGRKEREKVLISHVETPIILWGQKILPENLSELNNISEQLAILCPESPSISVRPEMDKIYAAKFSDDGLWYRCIVRYFFGPDRVKVQYIDYGNTEEIDPSNLVELPKTVASLPTCAMKYMLHFLWCTNNQDANGIAFLRELVESKEVEVITTARLTDQTGYYSEVYVDGVSVIDKMLESGHAYRKPGMDMRGAKSRIQGGSGDAAMNPVGKGPGQVSFGSRKFDGPQEKDEVSSLRWKLKNLQLEYTNLSTQVQENDIGSMLKSLQMLSMKARKYRNQFPLDKDTPLDLAIKLMKSPDSISLNMAQSLPDVIKSINFYKDAQDDILKCSENTQLEELIARRNTVRKDLYKQLTITIDELENVPLEDRGRHVQDIVAVLTKHYDYFIKLSMTSATAIDTMIPKFHEWKAQKRTEIAEARRLSDTMESKAGSVFTQIKQLMSLNPDQEDTDYRLNITPILKEFITAVQHEINISNTENGPDTLLIGSLVQSLLHDLREECNCVDHLCNAKKEFNSLLEQISPWLESAPSLDKVQKVRFRLKNLKSKLRHKLADKVDAEENQETEELETIAKDLEDLRTQLHESLTEENKLMGEMGQLANDHFPELLSGQDPGLRDYLMYKGLVKSSYSPEHFTMTVVGESSSAMFLSQFAGEPVLIKEYFLNSSNHLGKEDFIQQMSVYSEFSSLYLKPMSAVFFDKNNRHAFVVLKMRGQLLSQLVKDSAPSKEICQKILLSLCKSLECFQFHNFIHGQLHPEYVMVEEDGTARLLPPDFSLTMIDRCASRFLPNYNQEMLAPEIKHQRISSEPSHYTDVYNLGLLALWMHHPNGRFLERKDGTVDFSHLSLDRNLGIFLTKLLAPVPTMRPVATNILLSEYLNDPISIGSQEGQTSSLMSQRLVQGIGKTPLSDMDIQMKFSRNSPSPSLASQSNINGLVYTDTGSSYQMIANTRIPPPLLNQESQGTPPLSGLIKLPPKPLGSSTAYSIPSQSFQHQHQVPPTTLMAMSQNSAPHQPSPQPSIELGTDQVLPNQHISCSPKDSFEIGTFDPSDYEVTSNSPETQPSTYSTMISRAAESAEEGTDETEWLQGCEADTSEWHKEPEDSESLQTST